MNWCRKGYCCPWYGRHRFRKMVSMHLFILLISSFSACPLLSSIVFTPIFRICSAPIFFFNATDFFFSNNYFVDGSSFCILCSNFIISLIVFCLSNHKFDCFCLSGYSSLYMLKFARQTDISESVYLVRRKWCPSLRQIAQETRNRVPRVSTTCHPMAKVVIAFYSRYRVADANSISAVSWLYNYWPYLAPKWRD